LPLRPCDFYRNLAHLGDTDINGRLVLAAQVEQSQPRVPAHCGHEARNHHRATHPAVQVWRERRQHQKTR
jgi:hypothetical protein